MKKIKIILYTLLALLGVFIFVYGGWDDSPGAQGLGFIIFAISIWRIINGRKIMKKSGIKDTEQAFMWITDILERNKISFQILGGFAARIYGVKRDLADIDIEVADSDIKKILDEVKEFIIFGPARYTDENWNLNLLTLNYMGQEIDICSNEATIFNKNSKQWESLSLNLSEAKLKRVFGKVVPIVPLDKLIEYKSKLLRDVDVEDVRQLVELS
jgi:hypothetical protein